MARINQVSVNNLGMLLVLRIFELIHGYFECKSGTLEVDRLDSDLSVNLLKDHFRDGES